MPISTIFQEILQMTATASLCILAVLIIRLLLKKAPRIFSYALWSVVLFRLLCPFSFESVLSLIPSPRVVESTGQTGLPFQVSTNIPAIDTPVNNYLGDHYYEGVTVPEGFSLDISLILAWIWLAGCFLLLGFSLLSFLRLRKKLRGAVWEEGNIYRAKGLETAFVLGIFRPKIYLPEGLSEKERRYILLHEQTHIRRRDYLIRLAAFLALCIHWFNPLVWLAFFISSRDMEMSCDEAVLKKLGNEVKKDYSTSLLSLASGRRWVGGTPLAFGEGDTKSRIKNVLSYRKPAFWVLIAAIIGVAATIFLLAANPLEKRESMRWLNSLNAADIQQIELVVMPSNENERYALYTNEQEISAIVNLLRKGNGRYVENPESLMGGGISFDITMQDGSRHHVYNDANTYLFVDGDAYQADSDWLANWEKDYGKGNAPLPEDFSFDTVPPASETAKTLFALRTDYVGNAPAVGNLLDTLEFPDKRGSFALKTDTQPYELTVQFPEAELESFPYAYEKNAVLLLALIDNLDVVSFQYSGKYGGSYTRDWAEEWVGLPDVRVQSVEELSSLLTLLAQKAAEYDNLREEASANIEAQYLQSVLENIEFVDKGIHLFLPSEMPAEHLLGIRGILETTDENNEPIQVEFYDKEIDPRSDPSVQSGTGDDPILLYLNIREGDRLSFYLRFYEQEDENTISETANWYASWICENGTMVRQPWQPETQLRSWEQEENGETFLNFREPYGIDFTLSLTLPEGWTVDSKAGILTGGETLIMDETGRNVGTITPSSFTYYPEAAGENFPVSVYGELMLSSAINWNNEYTPVTQGSENADGIPVTETATVLIQHTDNGAAGPIIERPGILSYNLDIFRYVAISFEEGVSQGTARTIAQSIVLK